LARTVLLADDSVTAQNMGRRILMDAGYEVITVNNGSAALKKIHENKPDLIVLDVYMPGYGGLEVCQRLKESGETMRIPVLLTVGKMEPFKSDEAKRVRADAHIVKPFEASELLAALTRLEDRIVPQSEAPGKRGGKSEGKKARFWHADEADNAAILREESEKIAYLAQMKQRQSQSVVQEPAAVSEPETPKPGAPELKTPEPEIEHHAAVETSEAVIAPAVEAPESAAIQEVQTSEAETAATFASAPEPELVNIPAPEEFSVTNAPIEEGRADEIAPASPLVEASAVSETSVPIPAPSDDTTQRWVAENVPLSAEEASVALEQEMQQAQSAVAAREAETHQAAYAEAQGTDPQIEEPRAEEPEPEESKPEEPKLEEPKEDESEAVAAEPVTSETAGAAFAATAAAGSTSEAIAVSGDSFSPETPVVSEAAAAWQNWQQIRDSVMRPQQTAGIAEAIAQAAQASAPVQETSPSSPTPSSAMPALEGAALASIVDSVLAELKPKLMEEIAKKMAEKK